MYKDILEQGTRSGIAAVRSAPGAPCGRFGWLRGGAHAPVLS